MPKHLVDRDEDALVAARKLRVQAAVAGLAGMDFSDRTDAWRRLPAD